MFWQCSPARQIFFGTRASLNGSPYLREALPTSLLMCDTIAWTHYNSGSVRLVVYVIHPPRLCWNCEQGLWGNILESVGTNLLA